MQIYRLLPLITNVYYVKSEFELKKKMEKIRFGKLQSAPSKWLLKKKEEVKSVWTRDINAVII